VQYGVWPRTDTQTQTHTETHRQTDKQTRVTTIHCASSMTQAKCNETFADCFIEMLKQRCKPSTIVHDEHSVVNQTATTAD